MKNQNKPKDHDLEEKIYKLPNHLPRKIILFCLCLFFLSLSLNFPIKKILTQTITQQLNRHSSCFNYQDLKLNLLFLRLSLTKPTVLGGCFQQPQIKLPFKEFKAGFSFFGLIPPSLKLYVLAEGMGSQIKIYPRIGFRKTHIRLSKTQLSGKLISSMTPYPQLLKGVFELDGLLELSSGKIQKANFKIQGQDLSIPSQNISVGLLPFQVPLLNFGRLTGLATLTKKSLHLKALELGEESGLIHLKLKGSIALNKRNFNLSTLDLKGQFTISEELKEKISILKVFLPSQKASRGGHYQLQLTGTVANPKPKVL